MQLGELGEEWEVINTNNMNPIQQSALAQAMAAKQQMPQGMGLGGGANQLGLTNIPQNPGNPIINAAMQNGMNPGQPVIPHGVGGYGVTNNEPPQVQYPMTGGINPQGVNLQGQNPLLQHPQVQQALASVGQFLARIGHPLAQQFNAYHGFAPQQGGQGMGQQQSPYGGMSTGPNQFNVVQPNGNIIGGSPNTSMAPSGKPAYIAPPARGK